MLEGERSQLLAAIRNFRRPLRLMWDEREGRNIFMGDDAGAQPSSSAQIGYLPPIFPEWLGDRSFLTRHDLRFAYICGEMARGIASTQMVIAAANAGLLGFFGAAGLDVATVSDAIARIFATLGPSKSWGVNLIHSPDAPGLEEALVELYLQAGVTRASASAFLEISPAVVRYMASGLRRGPLGDPVRLNHVFAKVSRPEVATQFMSPPPHDMLRALVSQGRLTDDEAEIASALPIAEDVIAEADSGGHTDNRPLPVLLPLLQSLRDRIAARHPGTRMVRIGAAGGLGSPQAVAAAFAAGAAFVVTGSVNQASVEAGLSSSAKALLAVADMQDIAMAPSADMFEAGVKVQVLRKGTLFPQRAARLYDIYRAYDSLDAIPPELSTQIEREIFKRSVDAVWSETKRFFERRDPDALAAAENSPKVKLALVCRWYLGNASLWAITGEKGREMDFQIWCGPAQGAFNDWVKGSFLEPLENRSVVQIAYNLLEGAAVVTRAQQLRAMGVETPAEAFRFEPRPLG